jgi:hypothetical protein
MVLILFIKILALATARARIYINKTDINFIELFLNYILMKNI